MRLKTQLPFRNMYHLVTNFSAFHQQYYPATQSNTLFTACVFCNYSIHRAGPIIRRDSQLCVALKRSYQCSCHAIERCFPGGTPSFVFGNSRSWTNLGNSQSEIALLQSMQKSGVAWKFHKTITASQVDRELCWWRKRTSVIMIITFDFCFEKRREEDGEDNERSSERNAITDRQ